MWLSLGSLQLALGQQLQENAQAKPGLSPVSFQYWVHLAQSLLKTPPEFSFPG